MAGSIAALIVVCVLAAGAVFEVGRAAVAFGATLLLMLLGCRVASAGWIQPRPRQIWPWLLLTVLLFLPLAAMPAAGVRLLSPRAAEIYSVALGAWGEDAGTAEIPPAPSADWHPSALSRWSSLRTLSLGVAYGVVFLICAAYPWGIRVVHWLLGALVAVALAETLYAFLQQTMEAPRILWFACLEHTSCTGTYLNRNHFAGLLEMTLPLIVAAAASQLSRLRHTSRAENAGPPAVGVTSLLEWLSNPRRGRPLVLIGLAIVILVGLALSSSRSAFFFTLGALAAMAPLLPTLRRRSGQSRALAAALAVAAAAALWLSFPQFNQRLSLDDPTRLQLWADALDLIRAFPAVGVGLGNFGAAYPLFRSRTSSLWGFPIDHAHNDYLEWIGEVGIPAGLLSLVLLLGLVQRAVVALQEGRLKAPEAWTVWGCTTGVVTMLLHSLTDFNLHTPANALVFVALLGFIARFVAFRRDAAPWRFPRAAGWVVLATGTAWAAMSWNSWSAAAYYAAAHPDAPLADMALPSAPVSRSQAITLLRAALECAPASPVYEGALGRALLEGSETAPLPESDAAEAAATKLLLSSLRSAPLQPLLLLRLASLAARRGDPQPSAEDLARRADELSPLDAVVRLEVAEWLIARMNQLDADGRQWARAQIESTLALTESASRLREERTRVAEAYRSTTVVP